METTKKVIPFVTYISNIIGGNFNNFLEHDMYTRMISKSDNHLFIKTNLSIKNDCEHLKEY